ncbi:hypothetical protein [Natronococcus occultus]|uniref:Uncharacterized protein n=1 Tax=Natronococcus occultus SP4 TaxID=694430 RepID=L0K216_9EURY|nr:hypothetical protein [Natronococcus occultus]AGB38389.1 hypothetical protein Natoc_2627 [Natronococcus occultus SP4]
MQRRAVLAGASSLAVLAGCLSDDEVDDRGDIEIVIDGEPVDLSADRYQAEHAANHSIDFHLHETSDQWYMEGEERVTFAEGIDLLPYFSFETVDGDHVLEYDGDTYSEADDGTEMTALVDDEAVDPTEYTLEDGDEMILEVSTNE